MSNQALLEVRDLLVRFGGFVAIDHVNLTVQSGEIRCIIGPNGAGKTTLLDAICGKTPATKAVFISKAFELTSKVNSSVPAWAWAENFRHPLFTMI